MSGMEVDPKPQERAPPGVYRTMPSSPATSSGPAPDATPLPDEHLAPSTPDAGLAATDARHRFYQLRTLRRELSGRPIVPDSGEVSLAASPSVLHAHFTTHPVPASYGLPLDRLPVDDAATRYILRTAAAERALRHQQAENDELKRHLIAQRQETGGLRQQLEVLSHELATSSQTVLRQTVTMRALTSEMERRGTYDLVQERHASNADAALLPGEPQEEHQRRVDAPLVEVTQLKAEKDSLEQQLQQDGKQKSRDGRGSAVEAIERDDDDEQSAAGDEGTRDTWIPFAREELQRLVQAFGRVVREASPQRFTSSASCSTTDVIFEVTLSSLSFTATSVCPFPLENQIDSKRETSCAKQNTGALWVCGPYNQENLLLRVHVAESSALSAARRPRSQDEHHRRCCFYALPDTRGVLGLRFFHTAGETATTAAQSTPAATSTATVPVRNLLAVSVPTPWSGWESGNSSSDSTTAGTATVHTIHLFRDGDGVSCGAATFVASVRTVTRHSYRSHIDNARRSGGQLTTGVAPTTPLAEMRTDEEKEAAAAAPSLRHRRTPLLSPSREDDGSTAFTRRRLKPLSSSLTSEEAKATLRSPSHAPELVPQTTPPLPPPAPCSSDTAPSPTIDSSEPATTTMAKEDGEGEKVETVAPHHATPSTIANISSRGTCTANAAVSPSPPAVTVPLPPLVRVPAPPAAAVPSPPLPQVSSDEKASSEPPPSTDTPIKQVRIYVKSLCDFHTSDAEAVEDLLAHCTVQVSVHVAGKQVFAVPPRRNASHAVWSADEGACVTAVASSQDVSFEVRDASKTASAAVLARAVVHLSDTGENGGEKELTLTSVTDGAPCGSLTVSISPNAQGREKGDPTPFSSS